MRNSHTLHTALALVACAGFSAAQAPKPASTPPSPAVHEAAVVKAEPGAILLHVTGLTKDNQAQVKEALTSMGRQRYACAACKYEQAGPGKCPTCKADLVGDKRKAFAGVTLAQESSSITVTPAANGAVRLSEIESALAKSSVRVDESRLTLPGNATLILRSGMADNVSAVEKALKDAKLFDDVRANFDAARQELDVEVHAGAKAPTRATVAKAIEDSGTKARLADVVWGASHYRT